MAVHGDDFTLCGLKSDLVKVQGWMKEWFEITVRAVLGDDYDDQKEVSILGRLVKWTDSGFEYEADPKHRKILMDYFALEENSRGASNNGDKEDKVEEWKSEELTPAQVTEFRGLAARLNFLSQDSPDLQFPIKQCCRDMANPKMGSFAGLKKIARYLVERKRVVWKFEWQDECGYAYLATDSDWGGNVNDRRSSSGGVWMLGGHCIKTWSATQGAVALSSAEAVFYAMIEGVTRAKGLLSLAKELGFVNVSHVCLLYTSPSPRDS